MGWGNSLGFPAMARWSDRPAVNPMTAAIAATAVIPTMIGQSVGKPIAGKARCRGQRSRGCKSNRRFNFFNPVHRHGEGG